MSQSVRAALTALVCLAGSAEAPVAQDFSGSRSAPVHSWEIEERVRLLRESSGPGQQAVPPTVYRGIKEDVAAGTPGVQRDK